MTHSSLRDWQARRRACLAAIGGGAVGAAGFAWPALASQGSLAAGVPSRTALAAAMHRAAHQVYDHPLVFDDPLALPILDPAASAALRADRLDMRAPNPMRAYIVWRARAAEDALAAAVRRGVRQYLVLGAGLDTFAYRSRFGEALRVFEVDHPATQAWKRERLAAASIALPRGLTFAPVDFERETLAAGLARAGFRAEAPAFVSLLGVVMYLTPAAARATFRAVAALSRGSELILDHGVPDAMLGEDERVARARLARRVAAIGEPWINWYAPDDLAAQLRADGFVRTESLDPVAGQARYFGGRADNLRLGGGGYLMHAAT
ncbi:MAG: class I SAM-dependent methyltransferase [Burkholderiales bacterium]|nr:class I SAM-dependent methyltransferase [Burkholderiales bacterium]